MVLQGRVSIENTSAVKVADNGSVDYGKPPVRYANTVVPAAAAYVIEGTHSSPSLRIEFEIRDGQPQCVGFHLEAKPVGRGIVQGDLDALPSIGRLAEEVFLALATRVAEKAPDWRIDSQDRAAIRKARSDIRSRGDAELRVVAQVYRDNIDDRPAAAVEALGYTRRTALRRIEQARSKGYLPPTTRGKKNA